MNYIYNIKVNLKEYLINFYEWNETDEITTIDKIPLYLVNTKDYLNILNMNIKLNQDFNFNLVNDMCLFTNSVDIICVHFTNNIIDKISKLSLIEEDDTLDEIKGKDKIKLKYSLINKSNNYKLIPRFEEKIVNDIIEYINNNKNNEEIIDYLYYEWFNDKKSKNKYNDLINSINKEHSIKHDKLYKIIELIECKNV